MDKIKKVFSPGHSKDDEVMYGNKGTGDAHPAGEQQNTAKLYPTEGAPVEGAGHKEHGVLRQILNPGGDKYDTVHNGTTATTDADKAAPAAPYHYGEGEHTVLQQITNPGGAKYDPHRFSDTPSAPTVSPDAKLETDAYEKKHEHSVLRQILNPGGAKYDQEGYGTTAHVVSDSTPGASAAHSDPNTTTGVSQTSGYHGVPSHTPATAAATIADSDRSGRYIDSTGPSSQVLTDRTVPSHSQTVVHPDLARNPAIVGAAGGAAAYELHSSRNTAPSVPLGSSSSTGHNAYTTAEVPGVTSGVVGIGSTSENPSSIMNRPHPLAGTMAIDETAVPTSSAFGGQSSVLAGPGDGAAEPIAHVGHSGDVTSHPSTTTSAPTGAAVVGGLETTHGHGEHDPAAATLGSQGTGIAYPVDSRAQSVPGQIRHDPIAGPPQVHSANNPASNAGTGAVETTRAEEQSHIGSHAAEAGAVGAATGSSAEVEHEHGSKRHNKLQKSHDTSEHHSEKKPSLIHRILHPGEKHEKDAKAGKHGGTIDAETQQRLHQEEIQKPFTATPMPANLDPNAGEQATAAESLGITDKPTAPSASGIAGPDHEAIRRANE